MSNLSKILFIYLIVSTSLFAQTRNIKKCSLLPITDNIDGAIAYKVYNIIENELKNSYWCLYRSNSQLLYKFSQYRDQLDTFLDQPKIIQLVANKLNVGSIIRIKILNKVDGVELNMLVYGDSGEAIYFNEKALVRNDQIEMIAQQIKQWLAAYSKRVPYDGLVQGVLGDQIMIDVGRSTRYKIGQKFYIKKLEKVVKHPLLKNVVEWKTFEIAEGKLFNVSDTQIVGMVKVYKNNTDVQKGDWVTIVPYSDSKLEKMKFPEIKKSAFGKLGVITLNLEGGDHTVKTKSTEGKKINGNLFGVELKGEVWVTRNWHGQLIYGKRTGNLSKDTNNLSQSSFSSNPSLFKLLFGYRFLPLGFYFGPQFDLFGGYGMYHYDVELSTADGFGQNSFTGWIIGLNVDIPLIKAIRGFLRAELMPIMTYKETDNIYGDADTTSNLQFEVGGKFQWDPLIGITSSVQITSNKAKFTGTFKELQYQDTIVKIGLFYQF